MRLLIVEDDDDIAAVIEETLRLDGHSVDRASDGLDGLWMAREGDYGLIVLDLLMPEMNGYKVCETLRSEKIGTPILMLTAKVGEYDETDGLDIGADDYLRKPFSPVVLQARIRALLRRNPDRGAPTPSEEINFGPVSLNPRSRLCVVDGREVRLTGRQSQVLEAIIRTGAEPRSRADLLKAVWGLEYEGHPNIVEVNIGALRTKLGKDVIENVHGLGYRIRQL